MHFRDESGHYPHRSSDHQSRTRAPSSCCTALMGSHNPEAVLQIVIRTRQISHIVAMEQSDGEVVRDVQKMIDRRAQWAKVAFLLLHLIQMDAIGRLHLGPRVLLLVRQQMCCLVDQSIRLLQAWPQLSCRVQASREELMQLVQGRREPLFSSTRLIESLIWWSRVWSVIPAASIGARPSSVRALRTAKQ